MLIPWRVYLEPKCKTLVLVWGQRYGFWVRALHQRLAEVEGSSLLDQCIRPPGVTLPMGIIVGGRNFGETKSHLFFSKILSNLWDKLYTNQNWWLDF